MQLRGSRSARRTRSADDVTAVVGVWLMVLLLLVFSIGQSVYADTRPSLPVKVLCCVLSVVVVAAFLRFTVLFARGRSGLGVHVLVWTQVVASLVILVLASGWSLLPVALASVLLLAVGPRGSLVVALLGGLDVAVMLASDDGTAIGALLAIVGIVIVLGFILNALTRLQIVLGELRRTRELVARIRVDEERMRISRDLHDLIGRTLVAVSLRNETALRLLDADVERCRAQLVALRSSVIDGQAKLRALTSGPTIVGLADELAGAGELFDRLGVQAAIDAVDVDDPVVDQTLAAVVREAVTNILKHGRPTWCRIDVRHEGLDVVVTVVNDGVAEPVAGDGGRTGLDDLRARVAVLGGVLLAGPDGDGRFRVVARVPPASAGPVAERDAVTGDAVAR